MSLKSQLKQITNIHELTKSGKTIAKHRDGWEMYKADVEKYGKKTAKHNAKIILESSKDV